MAGKLKARMIANARSFLESRTLFVDEIVEGDEAAEQLANGSAEEIKAAKEDDSDGKKKAK